MRLLVVTARYPTPDRPAAGAFVRDRLADPALDAVVAAPARYDRPGWWRYLAITWRALTAAGPFDGVEGHFILPSGPVAWLAARLRGKPLVVYAHGRDVREIAWRSPVHRWLARLVLRGADAVVTNAAGTAEQVSRLGATAEVVPPGIDLSRFSVAPRPTDRRVLYLGGDLPHKGIDVARGLADTLLGPGIQEVPPEEIPALLAAHDVLLVPSREEPFGLVAAEAAAAGRWVVARRVGGLAEIVRDGETGTLVDRDEDFAAALAAVPDYDPKAIAASVERFSLERHRAQMAAIWERVLSARRGGPRASEPPASRR
jgi:glycosyltransferase involved in cell wall biosynthesis